MAMTKCRECGLPVSTDAKTCPHCGKASPGKKGPSVGLILFLVGLAFLVMVLMVWQLSTLSTSPSPATGYKAPTSPSTVKPIPAEEQVRLIREQQEKLAAEEARWLKTQAGRIWQKHQDWPKDICEVIAQGKVQQGMTADQIRASWGKPDRIHRTVLGNHVSEQWVYDRGNQNQYIYLENGIMTSYSD